MNKSDVAREWRGKYPDMANLTLAKMMYNAKGNNTLFKNVENARDALRLIEGKKGVKAKAKLIKSGKTEFLKEEARPYNPYNLPKSEETDFKPFTIKGHKRLGVLSDIHLPYHSISAVTAAIKDCKKERVDGILINGDMMDFYGASRFDRDPRKRPISHELECARDFLATLQKQLNCPIYYKIGNHEERYERYLFTKAPELLGIPDFELKNLLKVKDYSTTIISDKRIIKANKLNIIHGHEFAQGFFSPVNVARGLFLRAKVSAMQGHNHASSEHTERDLNMNITTTWSLGCLCELNPAYMPINKWNHGHAIIDLDDNGREFQVRNKRIYNGEIL